ncbi:hypothetical protein QTP70_012291 [Hemibagrus guttatus]|uniref:Alkylated DNA repair protein AlkB homologue 8 N-terminal domain-containing protein n=1 Tax=Hemibagrus guttatus TaxID=175788 RepID=A0AAE0R4J0_9TELE|nr:hypothetical protein QTP70_012291 [Hemibagrus guttatus]
MVVDFRRNPPALPLLTIMDSTVATVESFRFLGSTISQDLKWERHLDSIVKKAQQRLFFLRQLRKYNLPQELLTQFYSTVIESVLCTSIIVWFGSATKSAFFGFWMLLKKKNLATSEVYNYTQLLRGCPGVPKLSHATVYRSTQSHF